MKKIMLSMGLVGLIAITAACGEESGDSAETDEAPTEETSGSEEAEAEETSSSKEETEETSEEDTASNSDERTEVGETIDSEFGSLTVVDRIDDVESFTTGPMETTINNVLTVEGTVTEEYQELLEMDDENIHYIQVNMTTENTSDETVTFYPGMATITTNTGEQLESDGFFSEFTDTEFIGNVTQESNAIYILENSEASDIESIRLLIDAPSNEDYETIEGSEDIDTEIELNQ